MSDFVEEEDGELTGSEAIFVLVTSGSHFIDVNASKITTDVGRERVKTA